MWRILFIVALVPTIVAVAVRKLLCDRVVIQSAGHMATRGGKELAERMLRKAGLEEEVEVTVKRRASIGINPARLALSQDLAEARDVVSLGEVAALTGMSVVAQQQPDLVKWRQWVVRFGMAFPVFTLVVVVFAVAVAKIGAFIAIVIVLLALGIASGLSLASLMVERESAKLADSLVEESHALPRRADGEEVGRVCRALAFRRVVPGAIEWLMVDPRKVSRRALLEQEHKS
jgi:hypothetical protein